MFVMFYSTAGWAVPTFNQRFPPNVQFSVMLFKFLSEQDIPKYLLQICSLFQKMYIIYGSKRIRNPNSNSPLLSQSASRGTTRRIPEILKFVGSAPAILSPSPEPHINASVSSVFNAPTLPTQMRHAQVSSSFIFYIGRSGIQLLIKILLEHLECKILKLLFKI